MSKYSEISKRIGWNGKADIPSLEKANELLAKVRNNNDADAFEQVFKIYRFAQAPVGEQETLALNVIIEAYRIGTDIFQYK